MPGRGGGNRVSVTATAWDRTADVVVVGYGGAGAVAAITARDAGAEVLVLEKQSERRHTSSTQMSLGVVLCPENAKRAIAYMEFIARVNVEHPESRDIDDDIIAAWAKMSVGNKAWLTKLGASGFAVFKPEGRNRRWPGNETIKVYHLTRPDGSLGYGHDFFKLLDDAVGTRSIPVEWNSPVESLITDGTGAVIGVRVLRKSKAITVRARRAVILTCGGFEHDPQALKTYLPIHPVAAGGNPGNTGDGLRLVQALGAEMWHMAVMNGSLKLKFPDFPAAIEENFATGAFMAVDRTGRRFKAETTLLTYSEFWNTVHYDTDRFTWPRIPVFYVFDETRRKAGPIVFTEFGAAGPLGLYKWSADNRTEVARGWIEKAASLDALAKKLGMEPRTLKDEVKRFNAAAKRGKEDWLGRPRSTMAPIEKGPFYAVKLWPGLNNTFGGPRRNARAQVMHISGKPIPRLYAAGELGSIFVQYPQSGANLGECIAFGRIAGTNAAKEPPLADAVLNTAWPRRRR